jgi:hypothetical protein
VTHQKQRLAWVNYRVPGTLGNRLLAV